MGLFKTKQERDFEKRAAIRKTLQAMDKQIAQLSDAEKRFIELAKRAKLEGIEDQYRLALSGLRSTMAQKKRVQSMKLNFEIMNQTRDMLSLTGDFLAGMGSLSKDMAKLCDEKQFQAVSRDFQKAMAATQMQEDRIGDFLDNSRDQFESLSRSGNPQTTASDEELDSIIQADLGLGDGTAAASGDDDFASRMAALEGRKNST